MSKKLKESMQPIKGEQKIADRVAETLNLFHDLEPLQPTGTHLAYIRKHGEKEGTIKYKQDYGDSEGNIKERDISMLTNISSPLIYLCGLGKALDVTDPCEARTKFLEAILRASRSNKGWGFDKVIEAMKSVRPTYEEDQQRGRLRRFSDWIRGK